jgi:hypothetical protein
MMYLQYGKCNNDICVGSNSYSVGRAAAWTVRIPPGQCLNNSNFGTWYSLSKSANCPEGTQIGFKGCAWQLLNRVKTINGTCAINAGMIEACMKDGGLPFTNAAAVLAQSLEKCPEMKPPPTVEQQQHEQEQERKRIKMIDSQATSDGEQQLLKHVQGVLEFAYDIHHW